MSIRSLCLLSTAAFVLITLATAGMVQAQTTRDAPAYELPPVNYNKTAARDRVAQLQQRFERGEFAPEGTGRELLLRVLKELRVPVATQTLVFSKTSVQKAIINPGNPRALYFTDDVYVGWMPGGEIEIAALDPMLGPVFYTLDASPQRERMAGFKRDNSCLLCHGYFYVRDVPGLFTVTTFPGADGNPLPYAEQDLVDDTTRFSRRWGGWYVTGYTGKEPHRGNAFGTGTTAGDRKFTPNEARPAELSGFFDTSRYPAATSDALALLILEHQTSLQTDLVREGQRARRNEVPYTAGIVDHLLFRRAIALPEGIVRSPAFTEAFMADAKRGRDGDSLKDLSLDGRLFRNRCSYLIYSDLFMGLPDGLRNEIFDRLYAALRDDRPDSRYAYLPKDERQRIYQILFDTHPAARARFEILAKAR